MHDRLDDAIDGAVRDMLDVEPPADLQARVMAQLSAAGARRPARGFRLPALGWVLGPVAAAAIVLVAVFVARRSEPVASQSGVIVKADTRLPGETPLVRPQPRLETPLAGLAPATATAHIGRSAVRPTASIIAATSFDADVTAMPPLNSIAPITVAPIAQNSIAPAELAMRPLDPITDVQIAPLTPPDRRN